MGVAMNVAWSGLLGLLVLGWQTPDIHFVPTSRGVIDAMLALALNGFLEW